MAAPESRRKKKIRAVVKLQIPAGQATPAPPVGTALGPHGVNIMEFVRSYNERTASQTGTVVPVTIMLSAVSSLAYAPSVDPTRGHILFRRDAVLMAQPFDAGRLELTGDPFPVAEHIAQIAVSSRSGFSVSGNGVLAYLSGDDSQSQMELVWFDRSGKSLANFRCQPF